MSVRLSVHTTSFQNDPMTQHPLKVRARASICQWCDKSSSISCICIQANRSYLNKTDDTAEIKTRIERERFTIFLYCAELVYFKWVIVFDHLVNSTRNLIIKMRRSWFWRETAWNSWNVCDRVSSTLAQRWHRFQSESNLGPVHAKRKWQWKRKRSTN